MTKKKAQFSPHIYAEWGELFKNLTPEQQGQILMGITMYPNYNPENNPVWSFIKSQIDKEFESFNERCEKNSTISKNYWNQTKANGTERIPNDTERHPKQEQEQELEHKQEQELKENTIKEKSERYGELKNVRLSKEQYELLKEKHSNIDEAIELVDTWLGTSGSKNKNKNHYAYFKSNSWVWDRVKPAQQSNESGDWLDELEKKLNEGEIKC